MVQKLGKSLPSVSHQRANLAAAWRLQALPHWLRDLVGTGRAGPGVKHASILHCVLGGPGAPREPRLAPRVGVHAVRPETRQGAQAQRVPQTPSVPVGTSAGPKGTSRDTGSAARLQPRVSPLPSEHGPRPRAPTSAGPAAPQPQGTATPSPVAHRASPGDDSAPEKGALIALVTTQRASFGPTTWPSPPPLAPSPAGPTPAGEPPEAAGTPLTSARSPAPVHTSPDPVTEQRRPGTPRGAAADPSATPRMAAPLESAPLSPSCDSEPPGNFAGTEESASEPSSSGSPTVPQRTIACPRWGARGQAAGVETAGSWPAPETGARPCRWRLAPPGPCPSVPLLLWGDQALVFKPRLQAGSLRAGDFAGAPSPAPGCIPVHPLG